MRTQKELYDEWWSQLRCDTCGGDFSNESAVITKNPQRTGPLARADRVVHVRRECQLGIRDD